jgi:hypothetical protein
MGKSLITDHLDTEILKKDCDGKGGPILSRIDDKTNYLSAL